MAGSRTQPSPSPESHLCPTAAATPTRRSRTWRPARYESPPIYICMCATATVRRDHGAVRDGWGPAACSGVRACLARDDAAVPVSHVRGTASQATDRLPRVPRRQGDLGTVTDTRANGREDRRLAEADISSRPPKRKRDPHEPPAPPSRRATDRQPLYNPTSDPRPESVYIRAANRHVYTAVGRPPGEAAAASPTSAHEDPRHRDHHAHHADSPTRSGAARCRPFS